MSTALLIDIVSILIGLVSIFTILAKKKSIGGKVGSALGLFIWGIVFMVAAFSYTIVFSRLKLLAVPGRVDVHHLLMAIGMVLFVVAARKFASLAQV